MCFQKPVKVKLSCSITTTAEPFLYNVLQSSEDTYLQKMCSNPKINVAMLCVLFRKREARHPGFQHKPSLKKQMSLAVFLAALTRCSSTWKNLTEHYRGSYSDQRELHSLASEKKTVNLFSLDLTNIDAGSSTFY